MSLKRVIGGLADYIGDAVMIVRNLPGDQPAEVVWANAQFEDLLNVKLEDICLLYTSPSPRDA